MRALFFLLLFSALSSSTLFAQDMIVTLMGDTLHVKIKSTNDNFVYFKTEKTKKGSTDVISRKLVSGVFYNVEPALNVSADSKNYKTVQIRVEYGLSRLIETETDDQGEFSDYYDDLRWGQTFGGMINFFINEEFGVGLIYSRSSFSNSVAVRNTTGALGQLSDDVLLTYIGANLSYRYYPFQSDGFLEFYGGLGYTDYKNNASIIYDYKLDAAGLGLHGGLALNISLGEGFFLPIALGFKGFQVSNIEFTPGESMPQELVNDLTGIIEDQSYFSVLRFQLSGGLLFSF